MDAHTRAMAPCPPKLMGKHVRILPQWLSLWQSCAQRAPPCWLAHTADRHSLALPHIRPSGSEKCPPARWDGTQKLAAERNKVVHIEPKGQSSEYPQA